ncbi:MAG: xylulokinase [Armatimonadota bacterium]|nr:xylulokinase [Armatimonadota bacterium]MDR7426373.1 xylulokinase [Armatimonadota bacterium]MDR7463329.1 xylulokinase [Armatimonadota bacterium]MDR7469143.1 xylulokinase [Armatimonadota bacterium]MDR7474586.1 xylulokinase [Armatimonadota bacterium]
MSVPAGPDLLLGIDLGTSAVKVMAVTPQGEVVGRGSASYEIHWLREGWAEQDPSDWWAATVSATRAALAGALAEGAARRRVAALGLSGQVNGVVLLDRAGDPLRPAVIWLDQRAAPEADEINRRAADVLAETALGRVSAVHAAAKLLWLLRHEPETVGRAWKAVAPKDTLTWRMTGQAVTDVTDAGATGLLDMRRRRWAGEVLDRLGLPRGLLPDVVESPTVVGRLRPEAAEALGLDAGTPVVAGAGDMAAITAGTGAIAPGLGCIMIGTAGQIALYMAGQPSAAPQGIWAMTAPVPGGYFWHGLVMTAGYCLTWLGEVLSRTQKGTREDTASDIGTLAAEAEGSPPGSRGLLFLPFLDGAATPHADPRARGAFFGATSTHRRADLVRAVMEGVAYNFRDAFEAFAALGARASRIRIGGGGARSLLWVQILADVLATGLDVLAEHDASALGAAVIAAVGGGVHADFETACRAMVGLRGSVEPDAVRGRQYEEYYALYRQLYPSTRQLAHSLARLVAGAAGQG